jgi:hypothetical protein
MPGPIKKLAGDLYNQPSSRLALNRRGKDDFKFFFGGKFFKFIQIYLLYSKISPG